jgi:hypothetical protein
MVCLIPAIIITTLSTVCIERIFVIKQKI